MNFELGREELPSTSNAPLKGGKATLYEGGIRVPMVVRWKGHITGGRWTDVPVHATDIFPTLLELGGYGRASYDGAGQSLSPLFDDPENDQGRYSRETFYWHYPFNVKVTHPEDDLPLTPHSAIRDGDYKLIVDWHGRLRLYDIAADPYETNDLADDEPEIVNALFGKLTTWMDRNVEPRYIATPNPAYEASEDPRSSSFRDLRKRGSLDFLE